jgi:hypothetical protein
MKQYDPRVLNMLVREQFDRMRPGDGRSFKIVDLGCGWGGMLLSFAEHWCDAESIKFVGHGVTLVGYQAEVASQSAAKSGFSNYSITDHGMDSGNDSENKSSSGNCRLNYHTRSYDKPLTFLLQQTEPDAVTAPLFDGALAVESLVHAPSLSHTLKNAADSLRKGAEKHRCENICS